MIDMDRLADDAGLCAVRHEGRIVTYSRRMYGEHAYGVEPSIVHALVNLALEAAASEIEAGGDAAAVRAAKAPWPPPLTSR